MADEIPEVRFFRRRTRTYDANPDNIEATIAAIAELLCPVGSIVPTLAASEPSGSAWKLCNGQILSKASYPRLYSALTGKVEEDTETFTLPDFTGKIPMGWHSGLLIGALGGQAEVTLSVDQLPSHGHEITDEGHTHTVQVPSVTVSAATNATAGSDVGLNVDVVSESVETDSQTTGLSIGNTGGSEPIDITPPVFGVNWMIRT